MGYKGESLMDAGYFYCPYLGLDGEAPPQMDIELDTLEPEWVDEFFATYGEFEEDVDWTEEGF